MSHRRLGFNPCFDGSVARGMLSFVGLISLLCFNPCFDGSVARGIRGGLEGALTDQVSILVLMEV